MLIRRTYWILLGSFFLGFSSGWAQDTLAAHKAYLQAHVFEEEKQWDSALLAYQKSLNLFQEAAIEDPRLLKRAISLESKVWNCRLSLGSYQIIIDSLPVSILHAQEKLGRNEYWVGDLYRQLATAYFRMGKYQEALHNYLITNEIWSQSSDTEITDIATIYGNIGMAYMAVGKMREAKAHFDTAQVKQEALGFPASISLASLYSNMGLFQRNMGDFRAALKYFEKGLATLKELGGESQENIPIIYFNIGNCYLYLNELSKAEEYFHQALERSLSASKAHNSAPFNIYNSLGNLHENKGDNLIALQYFRKAIRFAEAEFGKDYYPLVFAYNNVGVIMKENGDQDQAMLYYQKAVDLGTSVMGDNHIELATIIANMGAILVEKDQYEPAQRYFEKAINIVLSESGDKYFDLAYYYNSLGSLYRLKGESEQSRMYHKRALDQARRYLGNSDETVHRSLRYLGRLSQEEGKYKEALALFEEAYHLKRNTVGDHHPQLARSLNAISAVRILQEEYDLAIAQARKAILANISPKRSSQDIQWPPSINHVLQARELLESYRLQAKAYGLKQDLSSLQQADTIYHYALDLIEEIRRTYLQQSSRLTLQDRIFPMYESALATLFSLHQKTNDRQYLYRAFELAERSKASSLLQTIQESAAKSFAGIPEEVLETERNLKIEKAYYEKLLYGLGEESDSLQQRGLRDKVFSLKAAYDSLQKVMAQQYPDYYELAYSQAVARVEDIQGYLHARETAMLEFVVGEQALFVFLIQGENFQAWQHPLPKDFGTSISSLRQQIIHPNTSPSDSSENWQHLSMQLYQELLAPVIDSLSAETKSLLIIPDGILGYLPFEMLLQDKEENDDMHYLMHSYSLSYAYSASLLLRIRNRSASSTKGLAGFAPAYDALLRSLLDSSHVVPTPNKRLRRDVFPLPGAVKEVREITKLWGGDVFLKEQATETSFKQKAAAYQVLHLSMHAFLEDENSLYSHLLFNEEDSLNDGALYVAELYNMSLNAELAVLSACNTGSGKLRRGEGIMSLSRGFAYAGVPSTVMSLWKVPDEVTGFLMLRFHQYLKKGWEKHHALRQAKIDYLSQVENEEQAHPFYWAGFVLNGKTDSIHIASTHISSKWIGIALFSLVFFLSLFLFFRYKNKRNHSI